MEDTYKQIAEHIRIELLKRGIIVNVECNPTENNSFKVRATSFQTKPVLFKEVWAESSIARYKELKNEKGKNYTEYYVMMTVRYKHFDGGNNGCNLFSMNFRKFEDWDEVMILSIK